MGIKSVRGLISILKIPLFLALLAAFSLCVYLAVSALTYRVGYPLDDAWIHQTYARSLGEHGEWTFLPGKPSAGSTAPFWSALLGLGYALGVKPYLWTMILGWGFLSGMAWLAMNAWQELVPSKKGWGIWAGVLMVFEWHLVWAAGSGMETLAFAFLVLLALTCLLSDRPNWLMVGIAIGLSAWLRPDGITLAGPAGLLLLLRKEKWSKRFNSGGRLILGIALFFVPYLCFNRWLGGAWWPNTFFAKQAEYSILRQVPLWRRFFLEIGLPLIGVGAALLPGLGIFTYRTIRQGKWSRLIGPIWMVGYLFLYAWRLPVTYQHGRYVIPAMPVLFLWGLAGLSSWYRLDAVKSWRRVLGKTWQFSTSFVLVSFWILGARAYAVDVAIIESEMVNTAKWVAENLEKEALVAAHDIGALGYFGNRQMIDLAGLVSPEVIPFIRDEARLADYLNTRRVDYLVTFPKWYPKLVQGKKLVYTTLGVFSPVAGGENMTVYLWDAR